MQRLGPICLDSATQHLQLPFPSTFQKYRSHTAHARVAEKTLGSAAKKPAQAAPAPPEIPPSPVASARDPISLRWRGSCTSLPDVPWWGRGGWGGTVTKAGKGWETLTTYSQALNQPVSTSHPHWPDKRSQCVNANIPRLWDGGQEKLAEPHAAQQHPGEHSLGARVTPGWSLQPHKAPAGGDTEPTWQGLWISGLLTSCSLAPTARAPPQVGTGHISLASRERCPTQSRAAGACAIWKCFCEYYLSHAYFMPRTVLRPSPA